MAFRHNSTLADNEPAWSDVDKTALPRIAFADQGDEELKSTWGYPHHWVKGGTKKDEKGIWVDGELYLHRGGLIAAWAAAHGARSGEKASPEVIQHLQEHRKDIGLEEEAEESAQNIHIQSGDVLWKFDQQDIPRCTITAYTGAPLSNYYNGAPIVIDVEGVDISYPIPLLREHDTSKPVGHIEKIEKINGQLIAMGVLSGAGPDVMEIIASAKRGFPWRASVGLSVSRVEQLEGGEKRIVNNREMVGPLAVVRRSRLAEVSLVAVPADSETKVNISFNLQSPSSSIKKEVSEMESVEQVLASIREQMEQRYHAYKDRCAPDVLDQLMEDSTERLVQLGQKALEEGLSEGEVQKEASKIFTNFSLQLLRQSRPKPVIHREPFADNTILEAALCFKVGIPVEKYYHEQTLTAAQKLARVPLFRLIEQACSVRGVQLPLEIGTKKWITAAWSTRDIAGILGNVAERALHTGFQSITPTVPLITRAVSHSDFRTHEVYSLAISGLLEQTPADGELKYLSLGEEAYNRRVNTYGAVLTITRQDIINDDLGAFADMARQLGVKAVITREKAVYTMINSAGNFFHANKGNYISGASSALGIDSLGLAVQKLREQKGPNGDPILVEPKLLVVPPALEATALSLTSQLSQVVVAGSDNVKISNANIWSNRFQVVVSPYLGASAGGSDTAWYLIADPNVLAAFEVAYLNGVETPTVEYFGEETNPTRLGVTYRVLWDFGAALASYQAAVKATGA